MDLREDADGSMDGAVVPLGEGAVPAPLREGLDAAQDFARRALAEGTLDAYERAWELFRTWCETNHVPHLPASTATLAAYLGERAKAGLSASRLAVIRASVKKFHKLAGEPDPGDDEGIGLLIKGVKNVRGAAPNRKKALYALPAADGRPSDLDRVLDRVPPTLVGLRDRALILVGFAAALRRSELAALTVADIEDTPKGLLLHIRKSKGDQAGKGQKVALPFGRKGKCPVKALRLWLSSSLTVQGPIFRAILKGDRLQDEALTPHSVALIVKRRAQAAGLDPKRFSGHSLRSGFLSSAADNGASVWQLRNVSRHADIKTLQDYVARREAFDDYAGDGIL